MLPVTVKREERLKEPACARRRSRGPVLLLGMTQESPRSFSTGRKAGAYQRCGNNARTCAIASASSARLSGR